MIVQLSLIAALAVLAEAALSYLGLTPVSTPSWGRMLDELQQTMTVHPGTLVFPGLAVVLAPRSASTCSATGCATPSIPGCAAVRRRRRRRSPAWSTVDDPA